MLRKTKICIIGLILLIYTLIPSFAVSAAVIEEGIITIGTVTANTGDTIIVPILFSENPGVSGITISITYDSSSLEFLEDIGGDVIGDCETRAHPSKNLIRLVASKKGTSKNNGTLIALKFKIADKAEAKLHIIDIKYNSGDFCNWNLDRIMPKIISGGVNVNLSKSNCPHKEYSEWSVATVPSCLEGGAEQRTCTFCGHIELRDTDPVGHEFSKDFTIDKEATKTEDGVMSRHCIRCNKVTDKITYSLTDSEEGNIDNKFDTNVPTNDYIDELHKEQYPDKKPDSSVNKPSSDVNSDTESKKPINSNTTSSDKTNPEDEVSSDPSADKTEKTTAEKLREEIPEFDEILFYFKIAIIVLLVLMLI